MPQPVCWSPSTRANSSATCRGTATVTFYAGGQTAWVDELLVIEALRGTGIGRELMDAFEQWAADRQSVLVSLATRGAATFYEHRGYTSKAGYYKKYLATVSPH